MILYNKSWHPLEVMNLYGLPKLKWYEEDEELYTDIVFVLDELSKRYQMSKLYN